MALNGSYACGIYLFEAMAYMDSSAALGMKSISPT